MTLLRDNDPRFRGLPVKVALFVLLGVGLVAGVLVMLARAQGYFEPKTPVAFEAPSGTDLRVGMPVKLSGFKIGQVSSIALNERARVDVTMRIEDRYMQWVKADSLVSIGRDGLIGDSHLDLQPGNPRLPQLAAGETLVFEVTPGLADIAADVRARTLPVIDGMNRLLADMNDPKGDLRAALAELRLLAGELRETRRNADRLLVHVDALAREDVKQALARADAALAQVETAVPALAARTEESLGKLDAATAQAQAAASSATQAIDSASPRIDRLLDNSDRAVSEGRRLIDGAGRRWPFRGGELPEDARPAREAAGAPGQAAGQDGAPAQ